MKFLAALLFSLSVGWTMALPQGMTNNNNNRNNNGSILAGLPDGGYMIGFKDDGTPYIEARYPLPDLTGRNRTVPATDPATLAQKTTETKDRWGCVGDEFVDASDWGAAAAGLAAWCDAGNMVRRKKIIWWAHGDSEAWICNWAGKQNCNSQDYYNYMEWPIDYFCKPMHSGWFLQGRGNIGYGRGLKGKAGDPTEVCYNP